MQVSPRLPDILQRILTRKAEEVAARRQALPLASIKAQAFAQPPARGFIAALARRVAAGQDAVIAEIKKASPSKGLMRADFDRAYDPAAFARSYADNGASCLSVLTDRDFFQGADADLQVARAACDLPVLRKDFVLDEYQIWEARALGADCILLIVAALSDLQLAQLLACAHAAGVDALVEVHDDVELARALQTPARLIGINNRNLRNFHTRLDTTLDLKRRVPRDRLLVSESGIHTPADVARLRSAGVGAFLVGEAFMQARDCGAALKGLFA